MTHKRLVNELEKRGCTVNAQTAGRFFAFSADSKISWIQQNDDAICVRVAALADYDSPETDYFAGDYTNTIKQTLQFANLN